MRRLQLAGQLDGAHDHVITLSDGRKLGYAQYGDPRGHPVLNCHGGLISRNDVSPAGEAAYDLGLRILSPDRPGVGLSDRKPGHAMLDWASDDIEQLVTQLEIDELSIMGWSAGGQYALAAAYHFSDRVRGTAVIAGALPLDDKSTFAEQDPLDRTLSIAATRAPGLARLYFHATKVFFSLVSDETMAKFMCRGLPPTEADAVMAERGWAARILREGAVNPKGAVDDYRAMVAPWGFDAGDITTPVYLFQGEEDILVPPAWAEELANRIPNSKLTTYPNEGHLIGLTRREDALRTLSTNNS